MSVAEQDERLVLPGTLVSAYMRLCGKTDEELQKVELHHIRLGKCTGIPPGGSANTHTRTY
jgi:hypothetical protein